MYHSIGKGSAKRADKKGETPQHQMVQRLTMTHSWFDKKEEKLNTALRRSREASNVRGKKGEEQKKMARSATSHTEIDNICTPIFLFSPLLRKAFLYAPFDSGVATSEGGGKISVSSHSPFATHCHFSFCNALSFVSPPFSAAASSSPPLTTHIQRRIWNVAISTAGMASK